MAKEGEWGNLDRLVGYLLDRWRFGVAVEPAACSLLNCFHLYIDVYTDLGL